MTDLELLDALRQALSARPDDAGLRGALVTLCSGTLCVGPQNNGPIKIEVRTEINEDPARIAGMVSEVLERLNQHRAQGRCSAAPPAGEYEIRGRIVKDGAATREGACHCCSRARRSRGCGR